VRLVRRRPESGTGPTLGASSRRTGASRPPRPPGTGVLQLTISCRLSSRATSAWLENFFRCAAIPNLLNLRVRSGVSTVKICQGGSCRQMQQPLEPAGPWIVATPTTPWARHGFSASAGRTSIVSFWSLMQSAATVSESSVRGWQNRVSAEPMSNRHPEQDDIRPEYDFSQAVRGKHAARFSVSQEEPLPAWWRDAIRYDTQAWISEALRRSQQLEGLLVAYIALAFHLEPSDAGRNVLSLLEDPEGEAIRRMSVDLEARALSPAGDLRHRLDRLFRERNWLIHRSLHQRVEETKAAGRFAARLQSLCSEAAAMTQQLRQLILARFARAGMTRNEFEQKAEIVIQQWLAA